MGHETERTLAAAKDPRIDPKLRDSGQRSETTRTSTVQTSGVTTAPATGTASDQRPDTDLDEVSIKEEDDSEDSDIPNILITRPLIPQALFSSASSEGTAAVGKPSPAASVPFVRKYVPIAPAEGPLNRGPPFKKQKVALPRKKTGCYTCRKRRVKCDEGRPTCRNCAKGDRRCAGYDPALDASKGTPTNCTASPQPSTSRSQTPHSNSAGPAHPQPPKSSSMSRNGADPTAPASEASSKGNSNGNSIYRTPLLAHNSSPERPFDELSIDPALVSKSPTTQLQQQQLPSTIAHNLAADSHRSSDVEQDPIYPVPRRPEHKGPLTMAALCKVGGEDPPKPTPPKDAPGLTAATIPPTAAMLDEIRYIHTNEYARGIDRFLETTWYTTHSIPHLFSAPTLLTRFAEVLQSFATTRWDDYQQMRWLPSAESALVWELMCLPRSVAKEIADADAELLVVLNRLDIVEHLVTGNAFDGVVSIASAVANSSHLAHPRRVKFWRALGCFVAAKPTVQSNGSRPGTGQGGESTSTTTPSTPTRSQALAEMRTNLAQVEGRDCLYSMAIVHHFGPSFPKIMDPNPTTASSPKPDARPDSSKSNSITNKSSSSNPDTTTQDEKKLSVAKKFLEDQAAGQGTTQAVQRLCGMSVRSWGIIMQMQKQRPGSAEGVAGSLASSSRPGTRGEEVIGGA